MQANSRRASSPITAAIPRDETTRERDILSRDWGVRLGQYTIGRYALLLVALALHVALFLLIFPNVGEDQVLHGNLWLFYRDSGRALSGAVPYRDFLFEYPPGALLAMALPRLLAVGYLQYRVLFFVECAVLDAIIVVALYSAARAAGLPAWRVLGLYTLAIVLLGPLAEYRIDLAPAALTALALAAWLRGQHGAAAVALAAGTATKLYPGLLLPLLLIDTWRRRGPRATLRAAALFALTLGLLLSPLLLVTPAQLARAVQFQAGRHLQVESLWAVPVLLLHLARWLPLEIVARGRALVILGPGDALGALGTPLLLLVAVAIYWRWWQSRRPVRAEATGTPAIQEQPARGSRTYTEGAQLLIGSAALVLAAAILSKVLSPQYLIWVMAPLALLPLRPRATIIALCAFIAALPLTQWIYPLHYGELVRLISPRMVAVLSLRDLLLLIALVAILAAYWRAGHQTSR